MTDKPRDERIKFGNVPITDLAEAKRVGLVRPGEPGGCFADPGYDERDPSCQICFWSDKCAEATIMAYDELLVSAAQAMGRTSDRKKSGIRLPSRFTKLDKRIRRELSQVVRLTRETTIVYCYRTKRLVSVVHPIEVDAITLVFHNVRKDELDDSKCQPKLWVGDSRAPEKPFLFVQDDQIDDAFTLIEQVYNKLDSEFKRLNEDKYQNVKRKSKTELIQKAAAINSIRNRKRGASRKARCRVDTDREI